MPFIKLVSHNFHHLTMQTNNNNKNHKNSTGMVANKHLLSQKFTQSVIVSRRLQIHVFIGFILHIFAIIFLFALVFIFSRLFRTNCTSHPEWITKFNNKHDSDDALYHILRTTNAISHRAPDFMSSYMCHRFEYHVINRCTIHRQTRE